MYYNIRKFFYSTAMALVLGLLGNSSTINNAQALLPDIPESKTNSSGSFLGVDNSIPDEIAMFQTENEKDEKTTGLPKTNEQNSGTSVNNPLEEVDGLVKPAAPIIPEITEPTLNTNSIPVDSPLGSSENVEESIDIPTADIMENVNADTLEANDLLTSNQFGNGVLSQVNNELFSQMSDIEKQTALLTLQLRREKIKNEIEAIKNNRKKAKEEEQAKIEEKERKRIEWEKEQERKLLVEQQNLQKIITKLEKLRQEKIINNYKESLLNNNQEWIKNNALLYDELMQSEADRDAVTEDYKKKLGYLSTLSQKARDDAEEAKESYKNEISNLKTQISILKTRLQAEIAKHETGDKQNPFAQGLDGDVKVELPEDTIRLVDEYAVMEIRGKGDALVAKLINKAGDPFMVQVGTSLKTGHVVDEITQTYVRADKGGYKDYVYFSAGGILDKEPVNNKELTHAGAANMSKGGAPATDTRSAPRYTTKGIPSLGKGMLVK